MAFEGSASRDFCDVQNPRSCALNHMVGKDMSPINLSLTYFSTAGRIFEPFQRFQPYQKGKRDHGDNIFALLVAGFACRRIWIEYFSIFTERMFEIVHSPETTMILVALSTDEPTLYRVNQDRKGKALFCLFASARSVAQNPSLFYS